MTPEVAAEAKELAKAWVLTAKEFPMKGHPAAVTVIACAFLAEAIARTIPNKKDMAKALIQLGMQLLTEGA